MRRASIVFVIIFTVKEMSVKFCRFTSDSQYLKRRSFIGDFEAYISYFFPLDRVPNLFLRTRQKLQHAYGFYKSDDHFCETGS